MKVLCNKANPPLGGLLAVEFYRSSAKNVDVAWGNESSISFSNSSKSVPYGTSNDLIRILENTFNKSVGPLQRVTMNHWLSLSLILNDEMPKSLEYLDKTLGPITYLDGETLSVADLAVFSVLFTSGKYQELSNNKPYNNVMRWMKLIKAQEPVIRALKNIPADLLDNLSKASSRTPPVNKDAGVRQEGKFIDLPHAEMGKVVVRFPPEASGYLHIGHAKAALLNQYYQEAFEGKLIMRFDDTNPAKENAEFEKVILEDVALLEVKYDMFTHTSQYFDLMIQYCEKLIKEGKAFVDDTAPEQMKTEREQRIDSKNKSNSVEKNLQLWEEMKNATEVGVRNCVRAIIDMQSANGCLRDPTIYRCKPEPHPRTGTTYKVYPTYDFACPIVDSIEGVTHVLRTMEYHDRDPQFYWFIEALGLRKPYIWEYSRLSMTNTVLSKRKLTWFVEQGLVDGWDDPRMPTVRGVLRRGLAVEALRRFIRAQGSSRSVVFMEWDKIWAINKKVIDPIAPRFTALELNPVRVNLKGIASDSTLDVPLHPKNPDVGNKTVWISKTLLIDQVDAKTLKEGENTTFINYGNILIDKIHKAADGTVTSIDATPNLDNKDYKKTLKLTWIADTPQSAMVETHCVYFDHIISKPLLGKDEDFKNYIGHKTRWEVPMLGEAALADAREGDVIQLQRRGFFRVDVAPGRSALTGQARPLVLLHVPDGRADTQPKPVQAGKESVTAPAPVAGNEEQLNGEIAQQGELVRSLKAAKAEKANIDAAVKALLDLKAKYKAATGQDWKPGAAPAKPTAVSNDDASSLNSAIVKQGDLVRSLKAAKAEKTKVDEAVKALLDLKVKYKAATGQDWKPGATPVQAAPAPAPASSSSDAVLLNSDITKQGDLVRTLKSAKAEKTKVDEAVKVLLDLKTKYKAATGQDWKPGVTPVQSAAVPSSDATSLNSDITKQGDLVRTLKSAKAEKAKVDEAVKALLDLKAKYKAATGQDWKPGATPVQTAAAPVTTTPSSDAVTLNSEITKQGDLVRSLKSAKAEKAKVDEAVKGLLDLKAKYKAATGQDWKPGTTQPPSTSTTIAASNDASALNSEITKQGDLVRSLKSAKTEKAKVDEAVKGLLDLKAKYKAATGQDWKPGTTQPPSTSTTMAASNDASALNSEITKQGDLVRSLKSAKTEKAKVDEAVKGLLDLKAKYKAATGQDWKPGTTQPPSTSTTMAASNDASALNSEITKQGDLVRSLKSAKTEKAKVDEAVKGLLDLKAKYKAATGQDWKPLPAEVKTEDTKVTDISAQISAQGDKVRALKAEKADKTLLDVEVKNLLNLKVQYKTLTGSDWTPNTVAAKQDSSKKTDKSAEASPVTAKANKADKKEKKAKENKPKEQPKPSKEENTSSVKKVTRLGLEASKETDLPEWYSQVITKSEMIDYYDISGCYILRPWSYSIWESIRSFLSARFKEMGVKDGYFPIFVSKAALEREKTHISDFAPEVAWVTHSGSSELAEHVAVRPTSETVMYPAYARWIQSHRDLPLRLNQWNNVVRWEFKQPQPFLRTREFLWQEGHTAFRLKEEADEEVLHVLGLYARVYEDLLAIPVIKGRKTEKEKFAGADYTTTVEAYIPASGRGIQGATSHHLGQNFSKMFEIVYDDPDTQEKNFVYQNSWGLTTRTIGVMVLVHGDDRGLVLPPRIASIQVIVVPCGITASSSDEERKSLLDACKLLVEELTAAGLRAEGDYRDNYSPGWKFNHWELKGVPIRAELGPKDLSRGEVVAVTRLGAARTTLPRSGAPAALSDMLEQAHNSMLAKATKERDERLSLVTEWTDFTDALERKHLLLAPFCGDIPCEDSIKNDSARTEEDPTTEVKGPAMGAKSLCIPFSQPRPLTKDDKCIHPACKNKPKYITLFGRSY